MYTTLTISENVICAKHRMGCTLRLESSQEGLTPTLFEVSLNQDRSNGRLRKLDLNMRGCGWAVVWKLSWAGGSQSKIA